MDPAADMSMLGRTPDVVARLLAVLPPEWATAPRGRHGARTTSSAISSIARTPKRLAA